LPVSGTDKKQRRYEQNIINTPDNWFKASEVLNKQGT